ncbi:MAG TPA: histidine phosphatase family protein [Acidobacteriota bacterium]|nr:histidine phosphatase family protein [Acidobacteriota bacterium]
MTTQIYFIRHGQNFTNRAGATEFIDTEFSSLTPKGIEQAKSLAKELSKIQFDVIFVSSLKRARETASPIFEFQKAEIHYSELFREAFMGPYSKKSEADYMEIDFQNAPIEIENFELLCLRAEYILKRLHNQWRNKKILIVGHSGLNKALIASAKGSNVYDDTVHQKHCCINLITIDDDGTRTVEFVNKHQY